MKREVNPYDYMGEIIKGIKNGSLLTCKEADYVNTMSIAWGQIGIEWNKLIFTTFIRTGRFTHQMLEKSGEFSVNIPMNGKVAEIIKYCGTKSGKDTDKIKDLNLTLVESEHISAPAIKELPLTLECKVLYKQLQDKEAIPKAICEQAYPDDVPSSNPNANRDYHTMFMGEILASYIIEG